MHSAPAVPVSTKEGRTPNRQVKSNQPPSRQGKKALTAYFEPEVLKQLKLSLLAEAINELFKKYGRPHIA